MNHPTCVLSPKCHLIVAGCFFAMHYKMCNGLQYISLSQKKYPLDSKELLLILLLRNLAMFICIDFVYFKCTIIKAAQILLPS